MPQASNYACLSYQHHDESELVSSQSCKQEHRQQDVGSHFGSVLQLDIDYQMLMLFYESVAEAYGFSIGFECCFVAARYAL
jgi:hypothetical protein